MGTSHRHKLGVVGQPNWGKVSSSITGLANGVAELDMLDNNPPVNMTPQQKSKRQRTLGTRISQKYHHAIRDLLRASGGRVKVSNGQSLAFGYAGIVIAEGIAGTFQEIVSNGLIPWLQRNGISSLEEMSCRDILDIIRKYIDNGVTGLDDTAAKEALEHIMDLLESRMDDDFSSFEEIMNNIVASDEIKDLLDEFFGVYIFSFLSQSFAEKLEQEKGTETMSATMSEIKEQIIDDIKTGKNGRSVDSVDWSSEEGRNFIKTEFNRILYILAGNED